MLTDILLVNRFQKEWPLRAMNTLAQLKTNKQLKCHVFWARLASFGQLRFISDQLIVFHKSRKWLIDLKGPEKENINYTIVMYGKHFTAATPYKHQLY